MVFDILGIVLPFFFVTIYVAQLRIPHINVIELIGDVGMLIFGLIAISFFSNKVAELGSVEGMANQYKSYMCASVFSWIAVGGFGASIAVDMFYVCCRSASL